MAEISVHWLFPAAFVILASAGAQAQQALPACGDFRKAGEALECTCPAGQVSGAVWGSGTYTADSNICAAARHAGVIGAEGGTVRALRQPGQQKYPGSARNGVTSMDWGQFDVSFSIAPPDTVEACVSALPDGIDRLTCECPLAAGAPGQVWGSGPYTGDSDICASARHAGVITDKGGFVVALRVAGQGKYDGSIRNGVQSSSWDSFPYSLEVQPAEQAATQPAASAEVVPAAAAVELAQCVGLPAGQTRHSCICPPSGTAKPGPVWGTGPYTEDSDLCAAARHAGVIDAKGGTITALRIEGLNSYSASARNGIQTSEWGTMSASLVFDTNEAH